MIAKFNEKGAIVIIPENNTEVCALKYFENENPPKLIDGFSYISTGKIIIRTIVPEKQED